MFRWPVLLGLVVAAYALAAVTDLGGFVLLIMLAALVALGASRPPWWVFLVPAAFPIYAAIVWEIDPDESSDTIDDAWGAALLTFAFVTLPAVGFLLVGLVGGLVARSVLRRT